MLDLNAYKDLLARTKNRLHRDLLISVPAGIAFGTVYSGTKALGSDPPPTAQEVGNEILANTAAGTAATGMGLLASRYI